MLENYIEMIKQADMLGKYDVRDDKVLIEGEYVDVVIVTVTTSDSGDTVEAIFHKGTDTLFDMNVKHVCTCGHCNH